MLENRLEPRAAVCRHLIQTPPKRICFRKFGAVKSPLRFNKGMKAITPIYPKHPTQRLRQEQLD